MVVSSQTAETLDQRTQQALDIAEKFTAAYRDHLDDHIAVREAHCMAAQYPDAFWDIRPGDVFAGRRTYYFLAGFEAERSSNKEYKCLGDVPGYEYTQEDKELRRIIGVSNGGFYHQHYELSQLIDRLPEGNDDRKRAEYVLAFWNEHSMRRKYNETLTEEVLAGMGKTTGFDTRLASGFMRLCCFSLHYDKLLQLGIPGMRDLIIKHQNDARSNGGDIELYDGMLMALDVLVSIFRRYEAQAKELLAQCGNDSGRKKLELIAQSCAHVAEKKPETLHQAIQLFWIYNLVSDAPNYGRMDVYLGDFYCDDIDSGRLPPQQAEDYLCGLWQLISEVSGDGGHTKPNSRLVVGGKGRRNEANANRFALAVMDVIQRMRVDEPNVTLRFCNGQDRALFDKAISTLGEGCIHPGLYNDDEHIPMVRDHHGVTEQDAEQYLPEGCGELLIDHMGFGSPNNILLYPSALDLVLHNGFDTVTQEQRGLPLGELSSFDTFDKLVDAFKQQIDFTNDILAKRHAIEHQVERKTVAFLFMSMLTDDCIARGKALFNGGVRYLGGVIEGFGLTNTADSLAAIRELVYERKVLTLEQVVEAVDADFEGYDRERRLMRDCPKFGNDDDCVDALHCELSAFVNDSANEAGRRHGLDFFLTCNLNPGGLYYCNFVKATSDGRGDREALPMGNAPMAGCDQSGVTSLLNSMAKHPKNHAGYVHNLKLNKSMFQGENRQRLEALLDAYFANGGLQLMITALNVDDLQNALKEPEKYQHLQVRVAGWTSRFVDLSPAYQKAIIDRTMYGD